VELPECGHFPTLEYPDESAAALERWLQAAVV
jgi:pimeloyl-ACP methyl ester carboxylesterase